MIVMIGPCAVPLLLLKMEHLGPTEGAAIAILFFNYLIPIMIGTQILLMGPYDYVAVRAEEWLKSKILGDDFREDKVEQPDATKANDVETENE